MRFAVRPSRQPGASPRSHSMPCGDVPGRVHISVERGGAGEAGEDRLALYAEVTFWIRPGALASRRLTTKPQPDRMISRFSPALAATFRPGWPTVPFADRAVPWIRRSSTRMMSNQRARSVETFSHQSFRASASPAFSRAIARLVILRCLDPGCDRASLRCSRTSRRCRPGLSRGTCSNSPVDRAALTATPRSTPTTSPVPGTGERRKAGQLCRRRHQTVAGHAKTLANTTDMTGGGGSGIRRDPDE